LSYSPPYPHTQDHSSLLLVINLPHPAPAFFSSFTLQTFFLSPFTYWFAARIIKSFFSIMVLLVALGLDM
jgi:hypothetical protein